MAVASGGRTRKVSTALDGLATLTASGNVRSVTKVITVTVRRVASIAAPVVLFVQTGRGQPERSVRRSEVWKVLG